MQSMLGTFPGWEHTACFMHRLSCTCHQACSPALQVAAVTQALEVVPGILEAAMAEATAAREAGEAHTRDLQTQIAQAHEGTQEAGTFTAACRPV